MRCRSVTIIGLIVALGGPGVRTLEAHAGPRLTDPLEGATLGDSPTAVSLSFSERPEASLSDIRVIDTAGVEHQVGRPGPVTGDPLTLTAHVRPLDRGVYIVNWRVISAVDGHATWGAYAFGVRANPEGVAAGALNTNTDPSWLEVAARWLFAVGLVTLLGAAAAGLAEFGGARELGPAMAGSMLTVVAVLMLAEAQRRNAGVPFAGLLNTFVGRALIARALAIAAAVWALRSARRQEAPARRGALMVVAAAALAAMGVHVAAGHAAASESWRSTPTVITQWVHFAAVGVWLGGLAALLTGLRGTPSTAKADAVRRFSSIAAIGLLVVAATGVIRTVGELSSWEELLSTGYGRAILAKSAALVMIAALGAVNRWRSVPLAGSNLRPLRRAGGAELALTAGALAAAAMLGTLAPPVAGLAAPLGLTLSGTDFGTTVRVRLTTASDQPGPNRFIVSVSDFDSKAPVKAQRVSLRFTPLDDPSIAPTSLSLAPRPDNSYVGSGANLAFEGRWQITALVERSGNSVEVPMEMETRSTQPFVSILKVPGEIPLYTVEVRGAGNIRFAPDPERAGPTRLEISCYDGIAEPLPIDSIVVTAAASAERARQLPVRRLDATRFAVEFVLQPGKNRLVAVARSVNGTRMRAMVELDVPKP